MALQSLTLLESRLAELQEEEKLKVSDGEGQKEGTGEEAEKKEGADGEPAAAVADGEADEKKAAAAEGDTAEGEAEGEKKDEAADEKTDAAKKDPLAEARAAVRAAALEVVEQLKVVIETPEDDPEWTEATSQYDLARDALTSAAGDETADLQKALEAVRIMCLVYHTSRTLSALLPPTLLSPPSHSHAKSRAAWQINCCDNNC